MPNIILGVSRVTGFLLLFLIIIVVNESFQVPLLILIIEVQLLLFLIWDGEQHVLDTYWLSTETWLCASSTFLHTIHTEF